MTREKEIYNLLGMRTCQPFLLVIVTCFSLLVWGVFPGCSGDAGKTDNDGNQTSAEKPENYPLTVCVVSGEELGSMGAPYVHKHEGTTVKFCCKPCLEKFDEDPEGYLAKLEQ